LEKTLIYPKYHWQFLSLIAIFSNFCSYVFSCIIKLLALYSLFSTLCSTSKIHKSLQHPAQFPRTSSPFHIFLVGFAFAFHQKVERRVLRRCNPKGGP